MALPQPVYRPDTTLADLKTAETVLAVTLRLFVLPWREPGGCHPDWREGLRFAGLPCWTAVAFERLFQTVALASRRPLDVRGLDCPRLGYDEGRLLQIVGLLQHQRHDMAEAVLESWLPPAACRFALCPAEGLAMGLTVAGLIVPLRPEAVTMPGHQLALHPGLALVH